MCRMGQSEVGVMKYEADTGITGDFLKRVYDLHGVGDRFTHIVHDGGHEYHVPSVMKFLRTHLG